jgi:hypothetical protein
MYKLLVPLLLACAFIGCASKDDTEPDVAGKGSTKGPSASPPVGTIAGVWKGIPDPAELAHAREHGHPPSSTMLKIDADGKFTMSVVSHGKPQSIEGTAKIEGNAVSLTALKMDGEDAPPEIQANPITLRLNDSGKLADDRGNALFER